MKKIAIFGKPGSGKSVLSKKLAGATGIKLYPLDLIAYHANGDRVDRDTYEKKHDELLSLDTWIIDGLGPLNSFYKRLNMADTLVYVDLPYWVSYWLVTKRCLKGFFVKPEGWPEGSSVMKGTLRGYQYLRLSPKFWNNEFSEKLETLAEGKTLFVIQSVSELNNFMKNHVQ